MRMPSFKGLITGLLGKTKILNLTAMHWTKFLFLFPFRPHAHALGKRIIGMKTDKNTKESTIIADGDPQKPQAFYPLKDIINIQPGDSLFARCTYDSTGKNKYTNIGK